MKIGEVTKVECDHGENLIMRRVLLQLEKENAKELYHRRTIFREKSKVGVVDFPANLALDSYS
jgi:hypothetical protein